MKSIRYVILAMIVAVVLSGSDARLSKNKTEQALDFQNYSSSAKSLVPFPLGDLAAPTCDETYKYSFISHDFEWMRTCDSEDGLPFFVIDRFCSTCYSVYPESFEVPDGCTESEASAYYTALIQNSNNCADSGCENWACDTGDVRACGDGKSTQTCEQKGCGSEWGQCEKPDVDDPASCEEQVGNPVNITTGEVTYQEGKPDVEIATAEGTLSLIRAYSSRRAFDDYLQEGVLGNYSMQPVQSWGTGWYHQYEHTLFAGTNFFIYREPDGNRIVFDENLISHSHPSLILKHLVIDDDYFLQLDDGSKLEFKRAGLTPTDQSTPIYHLLNITEPSGRIISFQYYDTAESAPCNSAELAGKLCLITSDDGAFIHFSEYTKQTKSNKAFDNFRIHKVQYGRFEVTSDGQRLLHYSKFFIRYVYDAKYRKPPGTYLQGVLVNVNYTGEGASFAYDQELYEYTNLSYYRPDLGPVNIRGTTFANPFGSQKHILASDGLDVWLLKAVRSYRKESVSGYEFISGHEYDEYGRGAASLRAGERLRIAYFDLGQGQQITSVANESKNGQTAEYESLNGELVGITGDCECSLGKTESIERDSDSYTIAMRQQDPNLQDSSPGTRTAFTYDDKKRVIIQLDNWEGTPPQSTIELKNALTTNSALSKPTRVRTFDYSDSISSIPSIESRFFSVMCPFAAMLGENCPSSYTEPRTERVFDLTGTRIKTETEYGLSFDPETGLIKELGRTYDITYFPNSSQLYKITDPNNNTTQYVYYLDPNENDPCNSSQSSNLNNPGQVKEIWLNEHLLQRQGAYNEKGLIGCVIDENGVKTSFTYNYAGRVVERKTEYEGQGRKSTFTYRFDGQLTQNTNGVIYQKLNYFTGATEPFPTAPATFTFCNTQNNPNLTPAEIAAKQQQCITGLGQLGQAIQNETGTVDQNNVLFPAKITNLIFGPTGMPILSSASNASAEIKRQSGFAYDQNGNLWQQYKYIDQLADPNNLSGNAIFTKLFTYDSLNQLRFSQDERFNQPNHEIKYDALGRVESVTTGLGSSEEGTTRYKYDTNDNIVKVIDPDGRSTEFLYDDFGQLVIVKSPDTGLTKYMYDLGGNPVKIQYADGVIKIMDYDDRHRLVSEQFQKSGSSTLHNYYYDTSMISNQWAYCLNSPIRPPVQQPPDTTDDNTRPPIQQTPDPTNDNTSPPIEQNPASIPPFRQDPTQIEVSQHFLMGRLSAVHHGAGWTFYSHTPFGEIEATYEWDGDESNPCNWRITRYQYDDSGRLTSVAYPSGRTIRYVYNPEDLYPSRIELLVSDEQGGITTSALFDNISYDLDGNLAGYTAGQITFSAQWDLAGQANQRNYQGAMGHDFKWVISSRDGNGNIESAGDVTANKNLTLTYDGQDRLKSAIGTNLRGYQDCSYIYDASGNRILENCYNKEITYSYKELNGGIKTDQLETLSWAVPNSQTGEMVNVAREFTYDASGRTTNGYTEKFPTEDKQYASTYDLTGLLQTVDMNLDGQADYSYYYDHRNLRITKISPTGKTYYTYDLSGKLLSVQEAEEVREYIWLNNQPIAMLIKNGNTDNSILTAYILGLDHLGTPMRAWNWDTGEIGWAADYEAFGQAFEYMPHSSEVIRLYVDIRFPGQVFDYDTKLYYNWYRWYEPNLGRYLQPDPVADYDRMYLPLYAYAHNSPLKYIDPSGLSPHSDCINKCNKQYIDCIVSIPKAMPESCLKGAFWGAGGLAYPCSIVFAANPLGIAACVGSAAIGGCLTDMYQDSLWDSWKCISTQLLCEYSCPEECEKPSNQPPDWLRYYCPHPEGCIFQEGRQYPW